MKSGRLLLPCTEKIDLAALAYGVHFAQREQATLVPLALLPASKQQRAQGSQMQIREQADDFLQAVKDQAARVGVEVEPCVLWTPDVVRSIRLFAQEMLCAGIFLFVRREVPVLLSSDVITRLLDEVPSTLLLVLLSQSNGAEQRSHWLHRIFEYIGGIYLGQEMLSLFLPPNDAESTIIVLWPLSH